VRRRYQVGSNPRGARLIDEAGAQVDTLEGRIACQKEGFHSGIMDVEASSSAM
jgi:hypothetical protein